MTSPSVMPACAMESGDLAIVLMLAILFGALCFMVWLSVR